jgi:putative transcriptional regulator
MDYTGKMLIATPSLLDENFCRSVVLLLRGNDDDGVLGLVLNRESNKKINELWQTIFEESCQTTANLHIGGPVPGPLIALHTNAALGDVEVLPGVRCATSREALEALATGKAVPFRFFVGNAGWGSGQLAKEINEGAWYLAETNKEVVFADETEIWQQLVGLVGRSILSEILHTDSLPDDPGLN